MAKKSYDLYFPPRVIALIIAILLIGGAILFTTALVYGKVTLTSPQQDAFVYSNKDTIPRPLPQTYRLRPGRIVFIVGAPEHKDQEIRVTVIPFRHVTKTVTLQEKEPLDPNVAELVKELPYETEHFRIDEPRSDGSYLITLFPIINNPEDYESYKRQLNEYGQEAFNWIRSKGVDPRSFEINWEPAAPENIQ